MSKHTKEPWCVRVSDYPHNTGTAYIRCPDDEDGTTAIAQMCKRGSYRGANAARIVACVNGCAGINPEAVPDLLEALRNLIRAVDWVEHEVEIVAARAAIAKATGANQEALSDA